MKEIKISTQAEFDALQSPKEFTTIYIVGEIYKVNREIENTVIRVSGSAKIGSVYGSAKIDYVYDSAKIGSVYGSVKIGSVYGSAKIDYVYDSAKIGSVSGSAKIDYVSGSAKIDYVYDSAKIGSVSGSAKIDYVSGSAKIDYVSGSAKIDYVYDSAKIGSVYGSVKIDYVYDSAKIGSVSGSAKIDYVSGSVKIDYVYDSAKIDYVSGSAKIDYVYDSAKIDYVSGSAKIGSVSGSTKIGSVYDSAKIDYVYGYGSANIHNGCCPELHGYAVVWAFDKKCKPVQKSPNTVIIRPDTTPLEVYFNSNPIDILGKTVLLYKRVSKNFLTQEGSKNETKWPLGKKIVHPNWNPIELECGEGKFHACSRPIFCDEFRSIADDKYICLEVDKKDLFAWENPQYPRKISFKQGKVLYECDREGNKI